jgi:hypothetical protein
MRIIHFIFFLIIALKIEAQTSQRLNNSEIKIGEQTELIYELIFSKDEGKINFIPNYKTIKTFKKNKNGSIDSTKFYDLEIIENFKDSVIYLNRKQLKWTGKYTITSWDSGEYIIPSFSVSTQKNSYEFNNLTLKVDFPEVSENKDIYDIKEQFTNVDSNQSWFRKYWYVLPLILVIALLIYFLWKKRKKKKNQSIPLLTLDERILQELELLEKKELWLKNQIKQHYIEFSTILRIYLGEKYQLNLLEKTSFESILLLKQKNIKVTTLDNISKILNESDLVKFAKTTVNSEKIVQNFIDFRTLINSQTDEF